MTHACTNFCRTHCAPPPDKPQKVRKTCFLCRDFKKEKWDRFGLKPINWIWSCALRSFLLPHSYDDCSSKSRAVLLSHLFWPLHAITNHNLNVSHSTRFLLFLSNSQVSPKFKKSMLSSFHQQSTDSMGDVLVSGLLLSCAAFCSDTRVHNLL